MRCQLKYAIEDKGATLKEAIAPIPTIICNDVVRFRLDPEVECDKDNTANPAGMEWAIWMSDVSGAQSRKMPKLTAAHEPRRIAPKARESKQTQTNRMTRNR